MNRLAKLSLLSLVLTGCGGSSSTPEVVVNAPAALRWSLPTGDLPVGTWGVPLRGEAVDGEWTTWRGGTARTGTRLARGIAEPVIMWSARVGIQGYANTPLVGEEAVFVTSQGNEHNWSDSEDGIYALDRRSGAVLWFHAVNEDVNGGTLTDGLVIAGTDSGRLIAVHRETGTLAWEATVPHAIFHGPLVADGTIYLTGPDQVHRFDLDGQALSPIPAATDGWEPRGGLAWSDGVLYRTTEAQGIQAIRDGDVAWAQRATPEEHEYGWGYSSATFMPPMVIGGAVVALHPSSLLPEAAMLELRAYDASTGAPLWSALTEDMGSFRDPYAYDMPFQVGLPWLMNATLYYPRITAGEIRGFDLASGDVARTVTLSGCRRRQFATIVGVPSRGYLPRHDGTLVAFVPPTGEVAWQLHLGHLSGSATSGAVWSSTCSADPYDGTALFSTPAIGDDGTLYVGSGEGHLYAIGDATW